jgi:hypothetical protein
MALFLFLLAGKNILLSQNVMISNLNDPCEPAIIIDPKNPNVLIAGANLNNYYISTDTGYTWKSKVLSSSYGVWGDPVIAVDTSSHFYYFHLANPPSGNWIDRIVCQKSTDTGSSWSDGTYTGLNGTRDQDKEWCAIDRMNNYIYLTWTQFDEYASTKPLDSSNILFSRSIDGGSSWSVPIRINSNAGDCIDGDNAVVGAVPAVGPNGEIYVSWAGPNGLVFKRSLDHGITWSGKETRIDSMPGGWNYSITGISRANGLPVTACDLSSGPGRGTIYVNWTDQRNGESNTDVWLAKSTDGGLTWSPPKKVNDDTSKRQQFFSWMTIDQTNGYLYFVFYDRRHHSTDSTDVYVAVSIDGGNTFINRKISETPFLPVSSVFFGDYTNIAAHNGIIRPIWTRLNYGQLSIWTDITIHNELISPTGIRAVHTAHSGTFENYPNPAVDLEFISFKLHARALINLTIYDVQGKCVLEIIPDEYRESGKYIECVNLSENELPAGSYQLRLEIDGQLQENRLIKY